LPRHIPFVAVEEKMRQVSVELGQFGLSSCRPGPSWRWWCWPRCRSARVRGPAGVVDLALVAAAAAVRNRHALVLLAVAVIAAADDESRGAEEREADAYYLEHVGSSCD